MANDDPADREPLALDGLVPDDPNVPYNMVDVIKAVADQRDFFEIMPDYAKNILTGFGRMNGRSVGFVANNPAVLVREGVCVLFFFSFLPAFIDSHCPLAPLNKCVEPSAVMAGTFISLP